MPIAIDIQDWGSVSEFRSDKLSKWLEELECCCGNGDCRCIRRQAAEKAGEATTVCVPILGGLSDDGDVDATVDVVVVVVAMMVVLSADLSLPAAPSPAPTFCIRGTLEDDVVPSPSL